MRLKDTPLVIDETSFTKDWDGDILVYRFKEKHLKITVNGLYVDFSFRIRNDEEMAFFSYVLSDAYSEFYDSLMGPLSTGIQ